MWPEHLEKEFKMSMHLAGMYIMYFCSFFNLLFQLHKYTLGCMVTVNLIFYIVGIKIVLSYAVISDVVRIQRPDQTCHVVACTIFAIHSRLHTIV